MKLLLEKGKILTDWIREKHHDRKAFPELFDDGKMGLHDENRKRKISPTPNYSHKVLNTNKKYAESEDYTVKKNLLFTKLK